jgi:hypothetical protein
MASRQSNNLTKTKTKKKNLQKSAPAVFTMQRHCVESISFFVGLKALDRVLLKTPKSIQCLDIVNAAYNTAYLLCTDTVCSTFCFSECAPPLVLPRPQYILKSLWPGAFSIERRNREYYLRICAKKLTIYRGLLKKNKKSVASGL